MKIRNGLFFGVLLWTGAALGAGEAPAFPFAEMTIDQLQEQMRAGDLTARQLTEAYIRRILAIDQSGPRLHAVIELNPDALAIADELDAERRAGHVRSRLHGIPLLLKDNIATADRMQTTAGSLALVGAKPLEDAALVKRLRAAGAVILGKANMCEWANSRSSQSSSWSGRGGQVRSPYALDRDPLSSSSGSAVAVAANLCVAAVGTETDGSITAPASANGIVGLKPTLGLVSRTGIIPAAISQDTAGPMARSVCDAAILLEVIAGEDPADPATVRSSLDLSQVFAAHSHPLLGARIGIVHGLFNLRPAMERLQRQATTRLTEAGATVIDLGNFPKDTAAGDAEMEVLLYEVKAGVDSYLRGLGRLSPMKSLADVIQFNAAHPAEEMPYFGQDRLLRAEAKGPLTEEPYLQAKRKLSSFARTIDRLVEKYRLDALAALTSDPAQLFDPLLGGKLSSNGSSTPAAVAGYPDVTVPTGQIGGLPVGLSFFGSALSDAHLLALARDYERYARARRPPQFLPTVTAESEN